MYDFPVSSSKHFNFCFSVYFQYVANMVCFAWWKEVPFDGSDNEVILFVTSSGRKQSEIYIYFYPVSVSCAETFSCRKLHSTGLI